MEESYSHEIIDIYKTLATIFVLSSGVQSLCLILMNLKERRSRNWRRNGVQDSYLDGKRLPMNPIPQNYIAMLAKSNSANRQCTTII